MTNEAWINERVTYLKGLKNRTEQQELLILLHAKPERTSQDEKKLNAIAKAERAMVRANKARADASRLLHEEKRAAHEAERKTRNHRLIQQGLLIELSGLQNWDKRELLGALISMEKATNITPEKRQEWLRLGETKLNQKT